MSRLIVFVLCLCCRSFCGQCASLAIGADLSYPPFEMVDVEGAPCGMSIDIANALAERLGRIPVIENISFVGLIPSLNCNKIDIIISSLAVTDQRKQVVDFSMPYAKTGLCLLASSRSAVRDIADVNKEGVHVVVKLGTCGEAYAAKYLDKAVVRVLDKEGLCALEVVQGRADVFIYDQLSVYHCWKLNPEKTRAILQPFTVEHLAVAVRKGNEVLLKEIDAFLIEFRKAGGFHALVEKYFPDEKRAFEELGIPFVL